jgi:predicted nucleic acid-binding Zn ribbon protein
MRRDTCIICGQRLPVHHRSDKITCGERCRKRLSRARKRPSELCTRALHNVYELANEAHDGLFSAQAFAELAWLVDYAANVQVDVEAGKPPIEWWYPD